MGKKSIAGKAFEIALVQFLGGESYRVAKGDAAL